MTHRQTNETAKAHEKKCLKNISKRMVHSKNKGLIKWVIKTNRANARRTSVRLDHCFIISVTAAAGVIVTPPLSPPLYLPAVTERYQRLQHPILITMVTVPLLPLAVLKGLAAVVASAGLDQTNTINNKTHPHFIMSRALSGDQRTCQSQFYFNREEKMRNLKNNNATFRHKYGVMLLKLENYLSIFRTR